MKNAVETLKTLAALERRNKSGLPTKPSELIRVALADLRKCEADDRFRIVMGDWFVAADVCEVCLAGAVMAQSLGAEPGENRLLGDFPDQIPQLEALNAFRVGDVDEAFDALELENLESDWTAVAPYEDGTFHADMAELAADLEAEGF